MEGKKRILAWQDHACSTGFGTVSKNILRELWDTGLYDIDVVGINHSGYPLDPKEYPYRVFPAASAIAADRRYADVFGRQLFVDMAGSGQYDILFIIQDTFIVETIMPALIETWNNCQKKFATVFYFPIDGTPHTSWIKNVVSQMNFPVAYTKYAKELCEKIDPNLYKMSIIYHGANDKDFYPLENRKEIKKEFFKEHGEKFIVTNVARNQPRKDLHKTFAAFSLFHAKHPKDTFLYILAQPNDVGGNLLEIAKNYGLEYGTDWGCPPPGSYGANQGYPVEVVNKIYNASDLGISTSIGEGFGLSTLEFFRTKVPVLMPRNTALVEIIGENEERGYFCNSGKTLNDYICMGNSDNNLIRPTVDVYHMAARMEEVYLKTKDQNAEIQDKVEAAYAWVPTWKEVCEEWKKVFEKAAKGVNKFGYIG